MSRSDSSADAEPAASRGRPARSPFESARAKSWARAVVQISGFSLRALDRHCGASGSGQWSKYVAGRVSPTTEKLASVEVLVPGSSRLYLSPLWELLDPKSLGRFGPRQLYDWLDEPLRSAFCLRLSDVPLFWRPPENIEAELRSVMTLAFTYRQPFDVLGALLGSAHEAVATQNRKRLAYTSVALWILSTRLYDDERMMQGLWATLPERHIRSFARHTLGLVGELDVDEHVQEATRNIREIQRTAR